ncbi:dihydropteroate synthase [Dethiosulfatarculus sandiegensis]|uniref:Methionine synthase n=1 Tax=Dethiosulfatarculus sandiegensis TaxID=1429043 RepID=A0A0D2JC48_9BACT|nr:dihydropteroate synthase [Dethiosulfatarculus sandiegensis]KIX13346.1 methionine synthase [Dethiosulfatarculus sandiegensis]
MIIIGEKINGTRKKVGAAIRERDAEHIKQLALNQVEAGSDYLDVNAGTSPSREPEDMAWLVECIQSVTDCPLCLDSANPEALKTGLDLVKKTPIINSVSGEKSRIEGVLPLALEYKTGLILLALDDEVGIADNAEGRLKIVHRLVGLAKDGGLREDQLYVDPLVTAISTGDQNALITFDSIKSVHEAYPKAHVTCGLSNISFGMPLRSLINQTFMAMCIQMGLDSAIIDPNNSDLIGVMLAAEMLTGRDKFCQKFSRAYRSGKITKEQK